MKKRNNLLITLLLLLPLFIDAQQITDREIANIINISGKQRMLTQKMSKEALLIAKGIDVEINKKSLKETVTLFETTLSALLNGDKNLNLPKTEDEKIRKKIKKVDNLWRVFKPFINKFLKGNHNRTSLKAIEIGNIPLLLTMDSVVKMYEQKYLLDLEENRVITINLAGKERMLSQKMTKELLLISHDLESHSHINSLKKDGNFLKNTLIGLMEDREAMSNPTTKKEINEIKKIWDEYQYAIVNTELSKEGLAVFNEKEKKIIEKMTSKLISIATKIDKERYHIELKKSTKDFEDILDGLIHGNKRLGLLKTGNDNINKELLTVKSYWNRYKEIIINVDISNQGLKKAMKLNLLILKAMDRAVNLYQLDAY